MTLRLTLNQIHNPSNDWMSCTIGSNSAKICVSPIPPRSTRPIPQNLTDAHIVQEALLPPASIAKFTSSMTSASSSVVVSGLELQIMGSWKGGFRVGENSKDVSCVASIQEKEINGWFSFDSISYFFTGSLNTITKHFLLSFYSSQGMHYYDVRGDLQVAEDRYMMQGQSGELAFSFRSEPGSISEIAWDETISGKYLGFYERKPSSFELNAELTATRNGIITGKGTEDNRQFTIFGMVDARVRKFFFVRIKGTDVTYSNGDAQLQGEIFFQGKWQMGTHHGGFTLIKYIQDAAAPGADAAAGE
jgi:hypothetical protein